jgi:hypothetical protein
MERLIAEPDEITEILKQVLVKQSFIEGSELDELLSIRDKAIDEARREIQGTCYMIDYREKKLKIFDTYSGEIFHAIDLPGQPADFSPHDFDTWGTTAAIIDPEELQKAFDIPCTPESDFGLAVRKNDSYLYNYGLERQKVLGLTKQYIFGGISKKSKTGLPYDMYFSDDFSLLCLASRDEGNVYLFDVKGAKFTEGISVRSPGSNKSINLAISSALKKIFITDNLTMMLSIYDIATNTLTRENLNMGILGNLCLAPGEKSLYLVIIKPWPALINLDPDNFAKIKTFSLKGELFITSDFPCDLLTLSADKKQLFFMTFIDDPEPFTPVITVIDPEMNKSLKRFSLKDGLKPVNLCSPAFNPTGFVNRTLEELLVENGLLSTEKIKEIKDAILNGCQDELVPDEAETIFIEIDEEPLEFEVRHDELTAGAHGGYYPKKVNRAILSLNANKFIAELLVNSFLEKHGIALDEIPEEIERLEKIAEKTRVKLEYYDLEIVEIPGFYQKKLELDTMILRDYILDMLETEEIQEINTVPTHCPNCRVPLLGSWDCHTCGLTLDRPEDSFRRRVASVPPYANLPRGNFFVADPVNGHLFETNQDKIQLLKICAADIGLKTITAALRLKNLNILILDSNSGILVEVNPRGEKLQDLVPDHSPNPLNKPAGFTFVNPGSLLIADTNNHRVLETDIDGYVNWQYGTTGSPGIKENYLDKPMYIQKTFAGTFLITDTANNRVIEIGRVIEDDSDAYLFHTVWKYGNSLNIIGGDRGSGENELNNPVMAFRELSGNTIILDAGNKRVIEVNPENQVTWQYNTETEDEATNISNPTSVTRLINKDILIIGDGKYVRIMPGSENRIVWQSNFEELYGSSKFRVVKENVTPTKVKYGVVSPYSA